MSKKVLWPDSNIHSPLKKAGGYNSFKEFLAKGAALRAEQQQAIDYLQKAMPAMVKLLELKILNNEPLTVMRPLRYQTSELTKSKKRDAVDDAFYNTAKQEDHTPGKYVDVINTINPGTQLMFKGLDNNLREFIFEDGLEQEHTISFDERNNILTQTNIFEIVRDYFKEGELK